MRCPSFDQEMSKIEGEKIKCIPNNPNFLQASLDSLVKINSSVKLEVHLKTRTKQEAKKASSKRKLSLQTHGWIRALWRKKTVTQRSVLQLLEWRAHNGKQSKHAKKVWKCSFECKNLGDNHKLFLKTDVCLLADVFLEFQKHMLKTVRAGSSVFLYIAGPVLVYANEQDRSAAGTVDWCGHTFGHRKGAHSGRNNDG